MCNDFYLCSSYQDFSKLPHFIVHAFDFFFFFQADFFDTTQIQDHLKDFQAKPQSLLQTSQRIQILEYPHWMPKVQDVKRSLGDLLILVET